MRGQTSLPRHELSTSAFWAPRPREAGWRRHFCLASQAVATMVNGGSVKFRQQISWCAFTGRKIEVQIKMYFHGQSKWMLDHRTPFSLTSLEATSLRKKIGDSRGRSKAVTLNRLVCTFRWHRPKHLSDLGATAVVEQNCGYLTEC